MKAIIILNGTFIPENLEEGFVICADGGYDLLRRKSGERIIPDIILGDCDSIRTNSSEIPYSVEIVKFDSDKDMTDGELCVRFAIEKGYKELIIYGAFGGRQDHVEANLALLSIADSLGARAVIYDKNTRVYFLNGGEHILKTNKNSLVSIVPFGLDAHIIKTKGLKYPLYDSRLLKSSTRGISNIAIENSIMIEAGQGGGALIFIASNDCGTASEPSSATRLQG